jgi:hypothetical protein
VAPIRRQSNAGSTQPRGTLHRGPEGARALARAPQAARCDARTHTAAWALALAAALGCAGALAQAPVARAPGEGQREAAERAAPSGVAQADLAPDAPARHTVRPGDTLWSLAGLFLKSPWRWPELWGLNREQLRDPHRIYPGQTIVLVREGQQARLMLDPAQAAGAQAPAGDPDAGLPTVRVSPRARSQALAALPIAPVSARSLAPFLSQTVVLDAQDLAQAPRIVGALDGRLLLAPGDIAYARGELGAGREYRVFREPVPLRDPVSGEVLGYEARYVGQARALHAAAAGASPTLPGEVGVGALRLLHSRLEATPGDRLAPAEAGDWAGFVPRAPEGSVEARVVSILGEGMSAGHKQIVTLNRGGRDGMQRGHVLAVWRAGRSLSDPADPKGPRLRLPDERHGTVMLVRVFERISYALVLDVGEPVRIGDRLTQP